MTIELKASQFLLLYQLREAIPQLPADTDEQRIARDGYYELLNEIIYTCEMREREERIKGKLREALR